jgi:hypothetical protein
MIDHISLPVRDIDRSFQVFEALLTPLELAHRGISEAGTAGRICTGLEGTGRVFG